ncbi:MAG: flavin reductase family protein [Oligoflexia bacterium]|nr:flavin reductase family protein [Oligoflexia bacterium]
MLSNTNTLNHQNHLDHLNQTPSYNFQDVPFYQGAADFFESMNGDGAFLIARENPMTIGWANLGIIWGVPIITVLVRKSRHTHSLMEQDKKFTVCIPGCDAAGGTQIGKILSNALTIFGTQSGKNINKIKDAKLKSQPGKLPGTTILCDCLWFYEAEIVHKNLVDPQTLSEKIKKQYYFSNDFHTIYFGEIKYSYQRC